MEQLNVEKLTPQDQSFLTGEEGESSNVKESGGSSKKPFVDTLSKLEENWVPEIQREKQSRETAKSLLDSSPIKQPEPSPKSMKAADEANVKTPSTEPNVSKDLTKEQDAFEKSEKPQSEVKTSSKSIEDYEQELKREVKRRIDTQTYSSAVKKAILSAKARITLEQNEGEMSEEVADRLLSILEGHQAKEPEGLTEGEKIAENGHPFSPYFKAVTQDVIQNYLDVTEDKEYESKVRAFNAFLSEATPSEMQNLQEELNASKQSPMALLKKMLMTGEEFKENGYGAYEKAGGLRSLMSRHKQELLEKDKMIEKQARELDKKTKTLLKYEHYDEGTYKIDDAGADKEKESFLGNLDTLSSVNKPIRHQLSLLHK